MVPARTKIDALYLDRLRKARRMPFAEKFLAGEELFETACGWTKIGIKTDYPDATEAEVLDYLKQRLRLGERLERGKDVDDVRNVLALRQDRLDWDYVHYWTAEHGTRDLLDEILKGIPSPDELAE